MSIRIIKPGILTSIQDLGRRGFQSAGVPVSGAMDKLSLRLANMLCGNPMETAALEITLHGTELLVEKEQLIATCGSGSELLINGEPAPLNRTIRLKAFSLLSFKPTSTGCRTYLAVAGGFKARYDLGSSSTYTTASLGGNCGRILQYGDTVQWNENRTEVNEKMFNSLPIKKGSYAYARWGISPFFFPDINPVIVRFIKGPEWDWFGNKAGKIKNEVFFMTEQYNRMGYRLGGEPILPDYKKELLSTAVCHGTVQVTHQGNLILLMADAQTTGGYPRIAQVAAVDLPLCAQLRPGQHIRFMEISAGVAEELYLEKEKELHLLEKYIALQS